MPSKKGTAAVVISVVIAAGAAGFAGYEYMKFRKSAMLAQSGEVSNIVKEINANMIYKTYGGDTKIYQTPNSVSAVLLTCQGNTEVTFISLAPNGFYKVAVNGTEGYVKSSRIYDPTLPVPSPTAVPEVTMYIANVRESAMLREKPDSGSEVLAEIPLAETVVCISAVDEEFSYVRYEDMEGYVYSKYLTNDATLAYKQLREQGGSIDGEDEPDIQVSGAMYVTGVENAIYMRAMPDDDAEVIGTIALGEKVEVIQNGKNGYYKVEYKGQTGYSKAKYLTKNAPKATASAVESTKTPTSGSDSSRTMTVYGVQSAIYLRSAPDETAQILCEIPVGAQVVFSGRTSGGFSQITYDGKTGYAKSMYLR